MYKVCSLSISHSSIFFKAPHLNFFFPKSDRHPKALHHLLLPVKQLWSCYAVFAHIPAAVQTVHIVPTAAQYGLAEALHPWQPPPIPPAMAAAPFPCLFPTQPSSFTAGWRRHRRPRAHHLHRAGLSPPNFPLGTAMANPIKAQTLPPTPNPNPPILNVIETREGGNKKEEIFNR